MFASLKALLQSARPRAVSSTTNGFRRQCIPPQEGHSGLRLPLCGQLDLFEVTIDELQQLMADGQMTAEDYVRFCIKRVHQVNEYLKAVIEVNPDAVEIARRLDVERQRGRIRSKLHGIPVLVKDNMATKDGMQTTAGSWALLGSAVPRDAHVVHRLREAGAVILGHANMSEWASVRSSVYSTGYSPRGDQTRNPYDLVRTPKGSSSGSAVAVSANIVPVSYGTETDTSIIGPAQVAGIVGIKPTVGLTSRSGVIPISLNMDTVGSFGRCVADAVHALEAIIGEDPRDEATSTPLRPSRINYSSCVTDKSILKGAAFGLPMKRCWESVPESHKVLASRVIDTIRGLGAEVAPTDFPSWEDRIAPEGWDWERGPPEQSEFTVVKVDAYNGINDYLSELENTSIKTIEDIVNFNNANAGSEGGMPGVHPAFPRGQDTLNDVVASKGRKDDTYAAALSYTRQTCREEGIDGALSRDGKKPFDALLLCDGRGAGQQLAAQAGYPIICIPIGVDDQGIPISLSLQSSAWKEADLIKWASAIEDALRMLHAWRPLPQYRNATAKNIPIK